jgi:hypothetical protein
VRCSATQVRQTLYNWVKVRLQGELKGAGTKSVTAGQSAGARALAEKQH